MKMAPVLAKGRPPNSVFQDVLSEPIQGATTVVIHPGSFFLRIGRASDNFPRSIPHVIARRQRNVEMSCLERDPLLVPQLNVYQDRELSATMENTLTSVVSVLQSCLTSDGRSRYPTPPSTVFELNSNCKPEVLDGPPVVHWTKIDSSQDYIVGEEVFYLNPKSDFNVHWPMRRGRLNVHSGIGGSLSSILADIEVIWSTVIQRNLEIPLKDLKHYRVVLVIPDIYNRQHVKELVGLLLTKLGFGACFVHQEAVCSTFGAGLSYACVVDVGDQKTSVVCVEDGISHRATRLSMDYGGSDVTQVFFWLLKKCGFPYKRCDSSSRTDGLLLHDLKETMCHVNLNVCGPQPRSFQVKRPGNTVLLYNIHMGDECMVAPLSLFHHELMGLTGLKSTHIQQWSAGDPEDPHDENYLRETSQRRGPRENLDTVNPSSDLGTLQGDDAQLMSSQIDEDIDPTETAPPQASRDNEKELQCDQLLSIDQAVLQSIDRCPSDDVKRKMYSCILVVGGGMMFSGIHTWLHSRLSMQIPIGYRGEPLEIVTRAKDLDPRATTWKGAAVMSCLDTTQELWIRPAEWAKYGVKMLREKAPFICKTEVMKRDRVREGYETIIKQTTLRLPTDCNEGII